MTTNVSAEGADTPKEPDPEETTVIEVTEEPVDPDETGEPTETTSVPDDEPLEE